MNSSKIILVKIISLAPLAFPLLVQAAEVDHGYVELGAGVVKEGDHAAKAGEYSGLDSGGYLIGNFDVSKEDGAGYVQIHGSDLGLDRRALAMEAGKYNSYQLWWSYDQLPHLISLNAASPYLGVGSDTLTLPGSVIPTGNSIPSLGSAVRQVELRTDRTATSAGATVTLSKSLSARLEIDREKKQGVMEQGGVVGFGPTPASAILPKPIDFTTDNITAGLSYRAERVQLDVKYLMSDFSNVNRALTWDPLYGGATCTGGCTTAAIALEPDNEYRRLSINGALTITQALRASLTFEKGRMRQDEVLMEYRTEDATPALNEYAPARETAEAKIDTQHVQLRLSAKPTTRLALGASFRSYEQDNDTAMDDFTRVRHDSETTPQAPTQNRPYGYRKKTYAVDGSYYLGGAATLRMGAEREEVDRTYRARAHTSDDTLSAKLNTRVGSKISASLGYARARREGGAYDSDAYAAGSHDLMRQLDLWDRTRKEWSAEAHMTVTDATSVSLIGRISDDEYADDGTFGLKDSEKKSITLDISHSPREGITAYGYITKDDLQAEQNGRYFTAAPGNAGDDWIAAHEDDAITLGLGGQAKLLEERLTVKLELTRVAGTYDIDYILAPSARLTSPMKQAETTRTTIELSGAYDMTESLVLGAGYRCEKYDEVNFLNEGYAAADPSVGSVLLLTGEAEDYTMHALYAVIGYKW
ncbi:MAG: MtrB/PioB family decaheme-associated outer membrane protein [Pseudomonadota bacterium]